MSEIRPALSAAEWNDFAIDRAKWDLDDGDDCYQSISHVNIGDDGTLVLESHEKQSATFDFGGVVFVPPESLPATIALANAALADDHPGKLTRADVDALTDILGTDSDSGPDYNGALASLDIARRAVRKVAALLPPTT